MEVKFMDHYFIEMVHIMKEDLITLVNLMEKELIFGLRQK